MIPPAHISYDEIEDTLQVSTPPRYPEDGPSETFDDKSAEILRNLAVYVIPSRNPRLTLVALFHAAGVDLSYILNCENSLTEIAKVMGVPKTTFSTMVQQVRRDFDIGHSSTKHIGRTSDVYSSSNFRKPKA
jgi:hypothetical protein